MRSWSICFFINLFVILTAKGQQLLPALRPVKEPLPSQILQRSQPPADLLHIKASVRPSFNIPVKTVPATYYKNSLGFFCRKELELEKAIKFPVKFRLGSVGYTDKMEGKRTALPLP